MASVADIRMYNENLATGRGEIASLGVPACSEAMARFANHRTPRVETHADSERWED